MTMHAAFYCYDNDLSGQRTRRKIATGLKVKPLDLCRPDVYMLYDVDQIIPLWMWLKGEIKRLTEYSGCCDHFYHHSETTHLSGPDYIDYARQQMSRIFLGLADEAGRDKFDETYPLELEIIVPARYYKSHAPLADKQHD